MVYIASIIVSLSVPKADLPIGASANRNHTPMASSLMIITLYHSTPSIYHLYNFYPVVLNPKIHISECVQQHKMIKALGHNRIHIHVNIYILRSVIYNKKVNLSVVFN